MLHFAQTADAIASTSGKLAKVALLAAYLRSLSGDAALAAVFFSGRPFPAYQEGTLQVGGALLWRVIAELSGKSEGELTEIYRRHGDAGAVAEEALPARQESALTLAAVRDAFRRIVEVRGPDAKGQLLSDLLGRATPPEAKYIVKIISGDLRIGLKESLVEESIATAFDAPLDQVQRANMLLGDLGETLVLAEAGSLASARLRFFHPIDFMLASPVEAAKKALSYFSDAAIEDKYDGIRAQAHIRSGDARLFSRTRDEITESFPELLPALASLPGDAILDGEIVAWMFGPSGDAIGRALPFSTLQQRLGRKKVSARLLRDVPAAYLVFDILHCNGEILFERPLRERRRVLDELLALPRDPAAHRAPGQSNFIFDDGDRETRGLILRAPVATAGNPEDLDRLFAAARARGNEGLMIKDLDSLYTPGRRGKSWLKMKRELATLDVVVTAVEYGHGKRIGVLSDYTFAVWDGDRLVNIGKAYSGLSNAEIAEMTKWFLDHVTRDEGLRLRVEPEIVLEVAFNNMMRSTRHESGYALRFPRIVRIRIDKRAQDADRIERVKEIFEQQEG